MLLSSSRVKHKKCISALAMACVSCLLHICLNIYLLIEIPTLFSRSHKAGVLAEDAMEFACCIASCIIYGLIFLEEK